MTTTAELREEKIKVGTVVTLPAEWTYGGLLFAVKRIYKNGDLFLKCLSEKRKGMEISRYGQDEVIPLYDLERWLAEQEKLEKEIKDLKAGCPCMEFTATEENLEETSKELEKLRKRLERYEGKNILYHGHTVPSMPEIYLEQLKELCKNHEKEMHDKEDKSLTKKFLINDNKKLTKRVKYLEWTIQSDCRVKELEAEIKRLNNVKFTLVPDCQIQHPEYVRVYTKEWSLDSTGHKVFPLICDKCNIIFDGPADASGNKVASSLRPSKKSGESTMANDTRSTGGKAVKVDK